MGSGPAGPEKNGSRLLAVLSDGKRLGFARAAGAVTVEASPDQEDG